MAWWSGIKAELDGLFAFFLPPVCLLCGGGLATGAPCDEFCPACRQTIPPICSPRCPRCSLPYPTADGTDHLCESCLRRPPAFSRVIAAGGYGGALREAIHRFKYREGVFLDRPLGKLLSAALSAEWPEFRPDLIVPVPLHARKLRQRSYNQSLLLARRLGRQSGTPVAATLLIRQRATAPQQGLAIDERRRNLHAAFTLNGSAEGKRLLLVDDVLTTGTTADECCRVLRAGGAADVAVAVLARVPKGESFLV